MSSLIYYGLLVAQVVSALAIIALVLLQQGKGADMGSSFGSGSAGSLFGATGAANFMSRATKWAAVLFFVTTLGLSYVSTAKMNATSPSGVMSTVPTAPAVPSVVPSVPTSPTAPVNAPAVPVAPVPAK